MAAHSLICPFLNDDPVFAQGVEIGMLFNRMQTEDVVEDYFTRSNQDQILLLASRLKWLVMRMKPWGKDWIFICIEKMA